MAGDDLEPATGKRHQDLERNFITRLQRGERDPRGEQRQGALCKGFVVQQSVSCRCAGFVRGRIFHQAREFALPAVRDP